MNLCTWNYGNIKPRIIMPLPSTFVPRPAMEILESVSRAFDIPIGTLKGASRTRPVAYARFAAYHILFSTRHLSYQQIGNLLGKRDHTTVIYGCRRAVGLIATDPDFASAYERARHGSV